MGRDEREGRPADDCAHPRASSRQRARAGARRRETGAGRAATVARWAGVEALGCFLAAVVFLAFEMAVAALRDGRFFAPLQAIAGIALGRPALAPTAPLAPAVLVGLGIHLGFALLFGTSFTLGYRLLAGVLPALVRYHRLIIPAASVYALVVWLLTYYGLGPLFGWGWFARTDPLVTFFAYAVFFGAILGLYQDVTRSWQPDG